MSDQNYWTMQRLSRRRVFRGAALGGIGLAGAALIGCGEDEEDEASAATTPVATTAGGAAATTAPSEGSSSGDAKRGGTLRFNITAEPPNFDMHANSTYAVNNAIAPVFNQLVQFDPAVPSEPPEAVIPDLAESWEVSDDGLTYTFNLIQNGKFHSGQAFTSADVKATFDRIMDPPEGVVSPRRDQFAPVESVETPDDYTAVFNLSRPAPSLLSLIATGWNVIYSADDIANGFDFEGNVNGTGPFRMEEYLRGNRVVMLRNEEYHHDTYPYMDGVTVFIVPDASTALASFQSGELDVHRAPSVSDRESIKTVLPDDVVIDGPMPSLGFGCVNYGQREPWNDIRVRQALTLAFDRQDAIAVYQQGEGYIGGYFQPGGAWAISEDELRTVPGYDLEGDEAFTEARKLLDAAGVPEGFQTKFMVRKLASYERLALFLKDQWTRVGVIAELDIQETASAYDLLNQRSFDLVPWGHGYALDDPDALFAEFYVQEAPRNYSEVGSPEVDELFLKQSTEMDPEARLEVVHDLEKAALALYGKSIVAWGSTSEARYTHVMDRVKHPSTYNNARWERVWLNL